VAHRKRGHRGWTEAHVRRVFWRAGFGATPREARHWARRGKGATIHWLLSGGHSPAPRIKGPSIEGQRLHPTDEWGHDVLWWLDRMIRSRRPLQEKLTLFWHDHFATTEQDTPLMLAQNHTLRRHALGPFPALLQAVTRDPAMLLFLSLADSDKEAPNENYARELMELFTLGHGYKERDIRQAARALTGFRSDWHDDGSVTCSYDSEWHDAGAKRVFGRVGHFDWKDILHLCVHHPDHAPFMVGKLWDFFVGGRMPGGTRARLVRIYRGSGLRIRPVMGAILSHPALYRNLDAPTMVKSPVVFVAGALRTTGQGIDRDSWTWLLEGMGQYPFHPPSVAGWEWGPSWLSSNSMHVRFDCANYVVDTRRVRVKDGSTPVRLSPRQAVARARRAAGEPWISRRTEHELVRLANRLVGGERDQQSADMCQRVLRHLLISGPDAQVH
jgi:uncharacterized protein (DUF1800 family)